MAIAKMKKLTLVGLLKDKQSIFDAVAASGCVHLVETQKFENCTNVDMERERQIFASRMQRVNEAIKFVRERVGEFNDQHKKDEKAIEMEKSSMARPLQELTFEQLLAFENRATELEEVVTQIESLKRLLENRTAEIAKISAELETVAIFEKLPNPTTFYVDTKSTAIVLGVVPLSAVAKITEACKNFDMAEATIVNSLNNKVLMTVVVHKSQIELVEQLQALGLNRTEVQIDILPKDFIEQLETQLKTMEGGLDSFRVELEQFAHHMNDLQGYYDYLGFQLSKAQAANDLQQTGKTFILQGFCPAERQEKLNQHLKPFEEKTIVSFDDVSKDEHVPILYKNNKFVKNFEQVTNMYMPPSYHEADPNPVMSVFYIIIFGFMLADMGYGLILALAGLLCRIFIKQDTGLRKMSGLFGVCGVGAIVVGALYGGFFGTTILSNTIMPDPSVYPKTTMVVCLLFGVIHLIAAYLMNMKKQIDKGELVSAFGVSLMWALFFAGMFAAALQMALQFTDSPKFFNVVIPPIVGNIGLYVALGSVVVAMICSGHKKSVGGRLVSAFSSVYGLINLFGDVISYVRIFGLMLSGAMMAVVTNKLGMDLINGGGIGFVFGPILIIVVHLFNLAMGVLGIYIHNGRLQYVEFFGKFYEGEGSLFKPLGSDFKYTLITK